MKHLNRILVPTDLSEHSRRALSYGCRLAAEDRAALVILHVANELNAWQLSTQFEKFAGNTGQVWPPRSGCQRSSPRPQPLSRTSSCQSERGRECDQASRPWQCTGMYRSDGR
jgi:nucleotide-binding universal stress UspA family protein